MINETKFDIIEIRDYYPSQNNPSSSIWVYDQVKYLTQHGFHPIVLSPTPIIPFRDLFRTKFRLYPQSSKIVENYKDTLVRRPSYIKIPKNCFVKLTISNLSKCISNFGNIKSAKLIHAHFGQNGAAALSLKKSLNIPLITSFYGYDSGNLAKKYLPYYQELIKKGDLFLALSNDMRNDLLKLGFPKEKILVHHLGVDIEKFKINHQRKDNTFVFLTVARLEKSKGIQLIIKAFFKFLNTYYQEKEQVILRIIGGGVYEAELKKLVKNLQIEKNVVFINNLISKEAREIVLNEMKNCDVFLLASYTLKRKIKEGTPIVLMEAQACGKPCISTNHAGIPEVVINEVTGEIVPEYSIECIFESMARIFYNKYLYAKYSQNAIAHINTNFNHVKQMEKLVQIYSNYF